MTDGRNRGGVAGGERKSPAKISCPGLGYGFQRKTGCRSGETIGILRFPVKGKGVVAVASTL